MAYLRKRELPSGRIHWDIRYRVIGKNKTFTIGETGRRTAEKIYNDFCRKLADSKLSGEKIVISKQEAILSDQTIISDLFYIADLAELTRDYAVANKSQKTVEREQLVFKNLIQTIGNISVNDLTAALIEKYKVTRLKKISGATVNIELRIINTAIQQAKDLGWRGELPEKRFKLLKLPDTEPPEWLTEAQINLILANADNEFKIYLQFLLHTGCRRNEALGVTWKDIDLDRNQLLIRGEVGKMGKRRSIPINNVLAEVLSNMMGRREGNLFPEYGSNQVSMKFRRLAKKIDLPKGFSLHSLRSTFGSTLINMGVDIYTVSKFLGHSSVKVTEKHYLALDPEHAKSAINKLDYAQ